MNDSLVIVEIFISTKVNWFKKCSVEVHNHFRIWASFSVTFFCTLACELIHSSKIQLNIYGHAYSPIIQIYLNLCVILSTKNYYIINSECK